MSLATLGNCQHYWKFDSTTNVGNVFTDTINGATAVTSATATFATDATFEGLNFTDPANYYMDFSTLNVIGQLTVIAVVGYKGGGTAYGFCSKKSSTDLKFQSWVSGNAASLNTGVGVNLSLIHI